MEELLNAPVLPGEPVTPYRHHRLMIGFIILAVIIIAALLTYYFTTNNSNAPVVNTSAVVDARTQMINQALATLKGAQPATQAEVQAALKQLSKSKPVKATQAQIDQALSQLKAK